LSVFDTERARGNGWQLAIGNWELATTTANGNGQQGTPNVQVNGVATSCVALRAMQDRRRTADGSGEYPILLREAMLRYEVQASSTEFPSVFAFSFVVSRFSSERRRLNGGRRTADIRWDDGVQ